MTQYAVTYINMRNGRIGVKTFIEIDPAEAEKDFWHVCIQGKYRIISIGLVPERKKNTT